MRERNPNREIRDMIRKDNTMCPKRIFAGFTVLALLATASHAQHTQRNRPPKWKDLVYGGRFMDRFLPIPIKGKLTSDTWGVDAVKPRDITNGIEEKEWSYWGGNIMRSEDGKYHMFVCRWPENAKKGHMAWPGSETVRAVSDHPAGPYKVAEVIGKGHNPEVFQLKDGRYVLYVMNAYYISDNVTGPWKKGSFTFDRRGRKVFAGFSNLSFARRQDGSYLMVNRGGGMWVSKDGLAPYKQLTTESVYPKVRGNFEDPVLWRTHIQYHMIVNDWRGRIAYYLRSKDGVNWKVDPGEAYEPGIAKYEDGTENAWYKYERIKMHQDEYGRAIQANFAVIDYSKWKDKPGDIHNSKNISIPLTPGRLLTIPDRKPITPQTKEIRVKIQAEKGFDPHKDIDVESLRFGAPEEVNFGGGCKVRKTAITGKDLVITFEGKGNGITDGNFVAKLLGKTAKGKLLFGYARLGWLNYNEAALSARLPRAVIKTETSLLKIEIENFGQAASGKAFVEISFTKGKGEAVSVTTGEVPPLKPYEKTVLELAAKSPLEKGKKYNCRVEIKRGDRKPVILQGIVTPLK